MAFVYQYPLDAFTWPYSKSIIGKRYHADAIVLDWRWHDDDHIDFFLVEDEDENDDDFRPFRAIRVHADALDVRTDLWRESTIRWAFSTWEDD